MKVCIYLRRGEFGDFCATCPELPGCIAKGQTVQEAAENMHQAIRGYLASINDFVPEKIEEVVEVQVQK